MNKKNRKKLLGLLLVIILLAGSSLAWVIVTHRDNDTEVAPVPSFTYDSEVQKAIDLGLVPKPTQSELKESVTAKELYTYLNDCIKLKMGKYDLEWEKRTNAANSKGLVTRQDAAAMIYEAARIIEVDVEKYNDTNALNFQSDKLDKKFVQKYMEQYKPDYPYLLVASFIDVAQTLDEYSQFDLKNPSRTDYYLGDALNYVTGKSDCISGKKIMELTSDYHFRPMEYTTKSEAIIAVYRFFNSFEQKPNYINLENVGPNTIPTSLITKNSSLPDASNRKLPQWKGVGIMNKAAATRGALFFLPNRNFHEAEIKCISDSGFNFARVFLGFSTLGYPDYPENMVNEEELKELDQLIQWGMKYDVHICIVMEGAPGMANLPWPEEISTGDFFTNTKKQEQVKKYWQMLSKRYANIPNKYLSFNLMNEPDVRSDEVYTAVFKPIVEAIWKECPDRIVIADSFRVSGEGLAKMGVALSYHLYSPNLICYNGMRFLTDEFPYLQPPSWPLVYLPCILKSGSKCDTVTIEGKFDKGSIGIYGYETIKNVDTVLKVTANDKDISNIKVSSKESSKTDIKKLQKEYIVDFPEGTTKLEIKVDGWLSYGRIQIKQSGKPDINMYPHDLFEMDEKNAVSPKILVQEDGSFENSNSPKMLVDWNYIYETRIKEHQDIAIKNNVGFIIGEFAPFGTTMPKSTLLNYMDSILNGLNSSGLAWCNGGFVGDNYIATIVPYSSEYTFTKMPGSDLYINQELLSLYKKYTRNSAK